MMHTAPIVTKRVMRVLNALVWIWWPSIGTHHLGTHIRIEKHYLSDQFIYVFIFHFVHEIMTYQKQVIEMSGKLRLYR